MSGQEVSGQTSDVVPLTDAEMATLTAQFWGRKVSADASRLAALIAPVVGRIVANRLAVSGYREASAAADRFRDVLAEALGHGDENPGDDVLIADLRAHFGKTGPEPTRWRDFCTVALSIVDQINAERRDYPPGSPATNEADQ